MRNTEGTMFSNLVDTYKPAAVGAVGFIFSWLNLSPKEIMPYIQLIIGVLTIIYLVITIMKKCKK